MSTVAEDITAAYAVGLNAEREVLGPSGDLVLLKFNGRTIGE